MLWATRRGCHVNRTACIWLIRRFLDSEATFSFFRDPAEAPEEAELFDVAGARLSHHGEDCSFETFLKEYELEAVMNSLRNGFGMRKTGNHRGLGQPEKPHSYAFFIRVHNTL